MTLSLRRESRVIIQGHCSRALWECDCLVRAVSLYDHAIGEVPCWSYVTDGLRAFGQKEIVAGRFDVV